MKTNTNTNKIEFQELWANLSGGERRLICSIMRMLKSAKRSHIREVARAAAKWEAGIGCFIKVRLIHYPPRVPRQLKSSSLAAPKSCGGGLATPKLLSAGGSSISDQRPTTNN